MSKESEVFAEMDEAIDKYKKSKRDKAKEQPLTRADAEELIRQLKGYPESTPAVITDPAVQTQPTERQQIAHQLWKDQKALSIICLIAVILPICAIFITMIFGEMYALIISFVGMLYPLIMFIKSMTVQARLYAKYGFKPLFLGLAQQQRPMQPSPMQQQQRPKDEMEETML